MKRITMNGKYQTRDGRKVRVLCVDRKVKDYKVVALILSEDGSYEGYRAFTAFGEYVLSDFNEQDLIPVKTKREAWINIHNDGCDVVQLYKTKEEADKWNSISEIHDNGRVACVRVEWEE
jgi:hypothetical protein